MRKRVVLLLLVVFAIAGYVIASAVEMADTCLTGPGDSIEAKVVTPEEGVTFNATAYIAGHGGHIAVVDMRTMKPPTDMEKGRIVLTEAGSEMEGKIAGMSFEEVKKAGGTHGQAIVAEKGKKVLVAGTLSGDVYKIDLATGKKSGPYKVGEKFCGAVVGPDGNIYFEDMADGNVYVWDSQKLKTVDKMPVGKAVCGIQWTKNNKKAYITDMPTGTVYVYDWTTKKKIKEITSPEMTFLHQARMTPDGKYLFVSAPNEFDPGLKPPTHKSQVIVIDTAKDTIIKRIILPDDVRPHDFAFTKDGRYVFLSSRTYADDSAINVMDLKTGNIVRKVSACAECHKNAGVTVRIDKGSPLLCGIEVDWH
ncbi:MAG TPA: YncE family protein [Thermodesulfovibrionales bacterium]|jgi:DNA-binding beta-propeller fold protein YncE|nr:YncE family protein [Thermodesulfovibrionales bacterium]